MLGRHCFVVAILGLLITSAWAQHAQAPPSPVPPVPAVSEPGVSAELRLQRQKKRYEDMKRDSQKLLELATQLKQYVDRSGENILSIDVMRKAEEMEKLARQVKNNMRGD